MFDVVNVEHDKELQLEAVKKQESCLNETCQLVASRFSMENSLTYLSATPQVQKSRPFNQEVYRGGI